MKTLLGFCFLKKDEFQTIQKMVFQLESKIHNLKIVCKNLEYRIDDLEKSNLEFKKEIESLRFINENGYAKNDASVSFNKVGR